jgi:hypothetical protein
MQACGTLTLVLSKPPAPASAQPQRRAPPKAGTEQMFMVRRAQAALSAFAITANAEAGARGFRGQIGQMHKAELIEWLRGLEYPLRGPEVSAESQPRSEAAAVSTPIVPVPADHRCKPLLARTHTAAPAAYAHARSSAVTRYGAFPRRALSCCSITAEVAARTADHSMLGAGSEGNRSLFDREAAGCLSGSKRVLARPHGSVRSASGGKCKAGDARARLDRAFADARPTLRHHQQCAAALRRFGLWLPPTVGFAGAARCAAAYALPSLHAGNRKASGDAPGQRPTSTSACRSSRSGTCETRCR